MNKKELERKAKRIEKNKALLDKFPILYPYWEKETEPGREPYDYSYTMLDFVCIGWQKAFLDTCQEIQDYLKRKNIPLDQFYFVELKEKYGRLDITADGDALNDKHLSEWLWHADTKFMLYCPHCGKPTKYCTLGAYVLYLCPECAKKVNVETRLLTAEDIPYFTEYKYDEKNPTNVIKTEKRTAYDNEFKAQWNGKE